MTPEGKSPKGNMPEKLIIAHSEYWGRVVISEDMIVNHTMQGRTIEHWVPESALLASEEKVNRYREALERIVRFNPSYSYTFENARKIAEEALK